MSRISKVIYDSTITPLSIRDIDELLQMYKDDVNIKNGNIQERNALDKYSQGKIQDISRKVNEATVHVAEIFDTIGKKNIIPINEIQDTIVPVLQEASEIPNVYYLFKELQLKDEYTYIHNICVGIISGLIAKWLGYDKETIREIELAGLLHDVGKTKITTSILDKPTRLTEQEYEEMKKHTIYGYQLLRATPGLSHEIALTALQHHEREDGNGYPFQLKSSKVHPFAKIIAVADVFHAMSSDRVYRKAEPFYQVISKMSGDVFGKFDPEIMLVFIRKIMETLIGERVELNDQRVGTIVMINQYNPLRTLIKLDDGGIIDLSKSAHIQIKKVLKNI